ncbi:MAG TPA: hypothetical protein VGJ37_02390 [Pyrinomonadaceae bacterium]|jgi:hypothetical protein
MKRCPQCLFIYPESDIHCDFDNTPLVVIDEAEIEAATTGAASRSKSSKGKASGRTKEKTRRTKPKKPLLVAVLALALGFASFIVYYGLSQRAQRNSSQAESVASVPAQPVAPAPEAIPIVSPSPVETALPSPSPAETVKPAAERVATAHSNTTVAPVSTSGPGMGKKLGGKPVILLTSGGKIDADEVWRTRDGVWYRRDGIVTLLKHGRVKAIVNQ